MWSFSFDTRHDYSGTSSGLEVPITISVEAGRSVALDANVDTGAEWCIFKRDYADLLDLRAEQGEPMHFSTANGGLLKTHGHFVKLSCFGYEFESKVYFAVDEGLPRNVLGRNGWLDRLRFGLVHYDRTLFLGPMRDHEI